MSQLEAGYGGRDLERQKAGEQSGAMAVVLMEDVDMKQGAVTDIGGGEGMGTK